MAGRSPLSMRDRHRQAGNRRLVRHLLGEGVIMDPVIFDEYLFTVGMVVSIFLVTFAVVHQWPGPLVILSFAPAGFTGIWLLSGDD